MSRRGNPYDNARAQRFMRTLKEEEVYGRDYQDLKDARSRIGEFLEQVYSVHLFLGGHLSLPDVGCRAAG